MGAPLAGIKSSQEAADGLGKTDTLLHFAMKLQQTQKPRSGTSYRASLADPRANECPKGIIASSELGRHHVLLSRHRQRSIAQLQNSGETK